jgi:hypothetical protein
VGWDVFFRVNQPVRDYYLRVYPVWEQVPGKIISYGDETLYHLHLRTH